MAFAFAAWLPNADQGLSGAGAQAQYCLGGNFFESKLCRDFRPWAIAAATVLAVIALLVIWTWPAKRLRAFLWRRAQLKVADKETMER